VAEHPALGSLREALRAAGETTLTVDGGQPTRILVRGAERRCRIATDPNADEGRPDGLYGNRFSRADVATVEHAATVIDPPITTNLIAIEAPSYGFGRYSADEIRFILTTAFSGFTAARLDSGEGRPRAPRVHIHTGFWGCGAYGGSRVLMAMLQILAARLARVDRLVFHTFDHTGSESLDTAGRAFEDHLLPGTGQVSVQSLVEEIAQMGFEWGVSDGN